MLSLVLMFLTVFCGTIAHTLFASLSHAALETWLTVLTRAGEGIYAVFNVLNQISLNPPWIMALGICVVAEFYSTLLL